MSRPFALEFSSIGSALEVISTGGRTSHSKLLPRKNEGKASGIHGFEHAHPKWNLIQESETLIKRAFVEQNGMSGSSSHTYLPSQPSKRQQNYIVQALDGRLCRSYNVTLLLFSNIGMHICVNINLF